MMPYFQALAVRSGLPAAQADDQRNGSADAATGSDWAPDGVEAIVDVPDSGAAGTPLRMAEPSTAEPSAAVERPVPEQAAPFLRTAVVWTETPPQAVADSAENAAAPAGRQASATPLMPVASEVQKQAAASPQTAIDLSEPSAAASELPPGPTAEAKESDAAAPWTIARLVQAFDLGEAVHEENNTPPLPMESLPLFGAEPEPALRGATRSAQPGRTERREAASPYTAIAAVRTPELLAASPFAEPSVQVHIGRISLDIRQPAPLPAPPAPPVPPVPAQPPRPAARESGIALNRFYLKPD